MKEDNNSAATINTFRKKAKLMLFIILAFFFVLILTLAGLLCYWSPGKPKPFLDEKGNPLAGSISEKIHVNINGLQQGMFIKGKDSSKPILLYLHGGMPDYFLTRTYPTGLEDLFTVVWWEQRGSGISYSSDISKESLTLDQMVSDVIEVTQYLRKRFGREKIYLMGHSGGTFIGIMAAAKAPELFHAYIGVAQMSYQLKSEVLAYDYMLNEFKNQGNSNMVRKLEVAPVTMDRGTPEEYLSNRDDAMHSLGIGTMHGMNSVVSGIFFPSLQFREYTLSEKFNLWAGKSRAGVSVLWKSMLNIDLSQKITDLKLPVYFFEGIYDYTCSYTEAKLYFSKIYAPVKGFYSFGKSAHSPMFEEPEKMCKFLSEDVLKGTNSNAELR